MRNSATSPNVELTMVTVCVDGAPSVALPVGAESVTVNFSSDSIIASLKIGTVKLFAPASPFAQVSVPETGMKSALLVAVPPTAHDLLKVGQQVAATGVQQVPAPQIVESSLGHGWAAEVQLYERTGLQVHCLQSVVSG